MTNRIFASMQIHNMNVLKLNEPATLKVLTDLLITFKSFDRNGIFYTARINEVRLR